ncbi:MAG: hypothetical protein FWF85_07240 [Clostridiales bacterium]|nr:hypothetical protein [Clostridiales bacterium]
MKIKNIKEIVMKYRHLGIYILLAAGGVCCLMSLALFLVKEPARYLWAGEIVPKSAGGGQVIADSQTPVTDQVLSAVADAPAKEEQGVSPESGVSRENPNQANLTDNPDNWHGYTVGEEVDGFVVRSTPPTEESGLYIQKPVEIVEYYAEETPPPPPKPLDRKVMQSVVGIISNYNSNISDLSPYDEEGNQNQVYYDEVMQVNEGLAAYLPEYSREFLAVLKDNQYFSYAPYLVDFLSGYFAGEGYDAKDFRGSADTREYLNEWIERVEIILGL